MQLRLYLGLERLYLKELPFSSERSFVQLARIPFGKVFDLISERLGSELTFPIPPCFLPLRLVKNLLHIPLFGRISQRLLLAKHDCSGPQLPFAKH